MYTTAEDWLIRFREAGGRGRYTADFLCPHELRKFRHEATIILSEIDGAANQGKYDEVLAYLNLLQPVSGPWEQF